jgi:hypothetical protein
MHIFVLYFYRLFALRRYLNGRIPDLDSTVEAEGGGGEQDDEEDDLVAREAVSCSSSSSNMALRERKCDNNGTESNPSATHSSKLEKKFKKMTEALCDLLNDYGLVSFIPLNIEDAQV